MSYRALCVLVLVVVMPGSELPTASGADSVVVPPELDAAIREYLPTHIQRPNFGGRVFCVHEVAGIDTSDYTMYIYLRALCIEYYVSDGLLVRGSGGSGPIAVHAWWSERGYTILEHERPRDGEDFGLDFKRIFPQKYHQALEAIARGRRLREEEVEEQARAFHAREIALTAVSPELDAAIGGYLEPHVLVGDRTENVFCAHEVMGVDSAESGMVVYVNALCMEYEAVNGELRPVRGGTRARVPVALWASRLDDEYTILRHEEPEGERESYSEDIERIFPERYRSRASSRLPAHRLLRKVKDRAREHFSDELMPARPRRH
jgi:hypothetical protein